jgi:hypothetical protein
MALSPNSWNCRAVAVDPDSKPGEKINAGGRVSTAANIFPSMSSPRMMSFHREPVVRLPFSRYLHSTVMANLVFDEFSANMSAPDLTGARVMQGTERSRGLRKRRH